MSVICLVSFLFSLASHRWNHSHISSIPMSLLFLFLSLFASKTGPLFAFLFSDWPLRLRTSSPHLLFILWPMIADGTKEKLVSWVRLLLALFSAQLEIKGFPTPTSTANDKPCCRGRGRFIRMNRKSDHLIANFLNRRIQNSCNVSLLFADLEDPSNLPGNLHRIAPSWLA